jgi:hypothetical protein
MSDVNFWAYRLGKQNGMSIRDLTSERNLCMLHTDASDVGYGAHTEINGVRTVISGALPDSVIGASSTAREIRSVILAASQAVHSLRNRRVRIVMDSYPAIRNFINGGGPVESLNIMIKEWWMWCRENGVTPLYQWVPREENTLADDLSKVVAAQHPLRPSVESRIREWLVDCGEPGMDANEWLQTRVIAPVFDHIQLRLTEMIRARRPACLIVPQWPGAVWRATLMMHSRHRLALGTMNEAVQMREADGADRAHAGWRMEAHLIATEDE